MSRTYDFAVSLASATLPPPARLLDFGCGNGEIVQRALQAGYDAHGTDLFEGVWSQYRDAAAKLGERLHVMPTPATLPFADARFDIITSNQVFEHIAHKPPVIAELARVLQPGGWLIAIFPTLDIVLEPHLKAPLIHRLRQGGGAQRAVLEVSHRLGLASRHPPGRAAWVAHATQSLANDMFYVRDREVPGVFAPYFSLAGRAEPEFLRDRLAQSRLRRLTPLFTNRTLAPLLRRLCLALANGVYVFERCGAEI